MMVHICQGNYAVGPDYDGQIGHRYFDQGRYKADLVCKIDCDGFLIEHDMTPHYEHCLGDKQLGVGAVDVQAPNVETGEQVVERIKAHSLADARADHHHELLRLQPPPAAYRARQAAGDERSKGDSHRTAVAVMIADDTQHEGYEFTAGRTTNRGSRRPAAERVGAFEMDLGAGRWEWSPEVAALFGFDRRFRARRFPGVAAQGFRRRCPEDPRGPGCRQGKRQVLRGIPGGAARRARCAGLPARDRSSVTATGAHRLRGTFSDINERKQLEARLLSVNETLEARVAELREETRALEVLNRTGTAIGAELDLERLVQTVTDAGVELSGAEFGAFFYNVIKADGEAYTLYTLSGAPREAFATFPMPRNTADLRADLPGTRPVALRRHSRRSPIRQERALQWNAGGASARAQLPRGPGPVAKRRSAGRACSSAMRSRAFSRIAPSGS